MIAPPELVVLSARAHPDVEVARAALAAIDRLPGETRKLYSSFVLTALPDLIRQVVEVEMNSEQIQAAIKEMQFELAVKRVRYGLQTAALELIRIRLGEAPAELEPEVRRIQDIARLTELVSALGEAGDRTATLAVVASLRG